MTAILGPMLRRLRREWRHTAAAIGTLALGFGAAMPVLALVDAALIQPLPYPEADRLIRVRQKLPVPTLPEMDFADVGVTRMAADNRTLTGVAAYRVRGVNLTGDGEPRRLLAAEVSAGLFDVLRSPPVRGRAFTTVEDVPQGPALAVIADRLWRTDFNGDPAIVGKTIRIDGQPHEVVGVMGSQFAFPTPRTGIWLPLRLDPAGITPFDRRYAVIGRLAGGIDAARSDLSRIAREVGTTYRGPHPGSALDGAGFQAIVRPLREELIGDVTSQMLLLQIGVGVVLLLATVNVTNLQLATILIRRSEFAVRMALGASRKALVVAATAEGLVIALGGAAAGLALGWAGLRLVGGLVPAAIAPDGLSLFGTRFVLVATILIGLVGAAVGALPTLLSAPVMPAGALKAGGTGTRAALSDRLRSSLAGIQVGLAVVLLYGAALLLGSARSVARVDPGFRVDSTLTFRINLPDARYPSRADLETAARSLLVEIGTIPGVRSAAVASALPLTPQRWDGLMGVEGRPFMADGTDPNADFRVVSSGYFTTMGISLAAGRIFRDDEPGVVMISRALARQIWPDGTDPLGRRLRLAPGAPWVTIVGLTDDAKNRSLVEPSRPELFAPALPGSFPYVLPRDIAVVLRLGASESAVAPAVRSAIGRLDAELPLFDLRSLRTLIQDGRARELSLTQLVTIFALLALILAAAGTYAVLSFLLQQQGREIAIRAAVGASRSQLMALVGRRAGVIVGVGGVVGVFAALLVAPTLRSFLFGVGTVEPPALVAVVLALAGAGAAAAWIPARRAATADPLVVLRED